MKMYVKGNRSTRADALRKIKQSLENSNDFPEGTKITIHSDHNCVDVIFPDNSGYQVYPRIDEEYDSFGYKYEYVGKGNGDYIKKKYPRKRNSYTSEEPYRKEVRKF